MIYRSKMTVPGLRFHRMPTRTAANFLWGGGARGRTSGNRRATQTFSGEAVQGDGLQETGVRRKPALMQEVSEGTGYKNLGEETDKSGVKNNTVFNTACTIFLIVWGVYFLDRNSSKFLG